jgi:FdhE protein
MAHRGRGGGLMPEFSNEKLLTALQEELQKRPELERTINLHLELVAARDQIEAKAPQIEVDKRQVDELLDERVPLLRHWEPEWDEDSFTSLLGQVCEIASRHREELAPQFDQIRSLLEDDLQQTRQIVSAYLMDGTVEAPGRPEVDRELLSFVLNNSLHPFLQACASVFIPLIDDKKWYQPSCPVCGGEPDLGYLEETVGGLRLLCSRCDTVWTSKRGECVFCGNSDGATFAYYLSDDDVYRLYVCGECKRYLKVIDGRKTASEPVLPVQRIVTVGMDVSARQEGYQ